MVAGNTAKLSPKLTRLASLSQNSLAVGPESTFLAILFVGLQLELVERWYYLSAQKLDGAHHVVMGYRPIAAN